LSENILSLTKILIGIMQHNTYSLNFNIQKFIILLAAIMQLNNCSDNVSKNQFGNSRRIPTENINALNSDNATITATPKTSTQPAYMTMPAENKQKFFNKLFYSNRPKSKEIQITDEVANNNFQRVKKSLSMQEHASKRAIVTPRKIKTGYYLQLGSFTKEQNARKMRNMFLNHKNTIINPSKDRKIFRVQIGPFPTRAKAKKYQKQLIHEGFSESIVIYN
jgi:cell division protein FtsN